MSEDVPATEPIHSPPSPSLSFFAQHRLAIVGAGVFILVMLFLLIGIAIGMAKKNFEKKFYLTQIENLKDSLTDSLDKRTELDKEMKELRIELRAKKDHIRELEDKVEDLKHANSKVAVVDEAGSKVPTAGGDTANVGLDPGEAYLRLKAGDCLIEGSGSTASNWQECLKKGKKSSSPSTGH